MRDKRLKCLVSTGVLRGGRDRRLGRVECFSARGRIAQEENGQHLLSETNRRAGKQVTGYVHAVPVSKFNRVFRVFRVFRASL